MNLLLLAAGALVVAGGIACVAARRPWAVALGAGLMLAGSPLLADPAPTSLLLAERLVGAGLAAELLWLGLRGRSLSGASALHWPPIALLAAAAFVAGLGGQPAVPALQPPETLATTLALVAIAIVAVAGRSDGIHLGLSGLVIVAAAGLVRSVLTPPGSQLDGLIVAGLAVAVSGAVGLLVPRVDGGDAEAPAILRSLQ